MADEVDIASYLMEKELHQALEKHRQNAAQSAHGSKVCIECGDAIPEPRRKLGFKLCVPCSSEKERKKQLFAN